MHTFVVKIEPDKVVRWCPGGDFWRIFAPCIFSEPRAAHFRPAFYIRTKVTSRVEVWLTSTLRPLKMGEEKKKKKERRKKKPQR